MNIEKARVGSTSVTVLSLVGALVLGACEITLKVGTKGHPDGGMSGTGGGVPGGPDGGFPDGGGIGGTGGGFPDGGGLGGTGGAFPDGGRDVTGGAGPDGGAGGTGGVSMVPPPRHAALTSASKVDLLFLIDDSASMAPLQAKLRQRMGDFMGVLQMLPGGMPDLHVAVVSSSLGAGVYGNVTGCFPGTAGNLDGNFQHKSGCGLPAGQTFLRTTGGAAPMTNFTGDIATVFSCIADLGQGGCGFEHQFDAVRLALQKAEVPGTENYGFLRPDAMLSVVFLTNEDDCSVPADSMLFDPNQQSTSEPLGGLQSYRCSEFGHRCDQPMPHAAPGMPVAMTGCHSAEDGKLVTVQGVIDFLYSLKPGAPQNVFVALIAGPTAPYVIKPQQFMIGNGGIETQPQVVHSCTSGTAGTEYADPAIRLNQLAAAFAPNSVVSSICADDFSTTMTTIAQTMAGM
jgi:hypothetical protein